MGRPQANFCTVTELRRRLGIPGKDGKVTRAELLEAHAQADPKIQGCVFSASRMVEGRCQRTFVPYFDTRRYDAIGQQISSRTLRLDEDLLEIEQLTNGDGNDIDDADFVLDDLNYSPKWQIRLGRFANTVFSFNTAIEGVIYVSGTWGFHDDWANALVDTYDTVQSGGIVFTDRTLTVTDPVGSNAYGMMRFEVGTILRIEDEYLLVTAINTSAKTLTVVRGYLNSTASDHSEDTVIYSYRWPDDVMDTTAKLATYLYQRLDAASGEVQILDNGYVLKDTTIEGILKQIDVRTRWELGSPLGSP